VEAFYDTLIVVRYAARTVSAAGRPRGRGSRSHHTRNSPPKLIGVTVLMGCPDESLRQVIRHKGEEQGADIPPFPQVAAAAWCPVTESPGPLATRSTVGPLWSFSQPTLDYDGTGAAFGTLGDARAVTVGLHYRVVQ